MSTECVWKECPDSVDAKRKYSVDAKNPKIATKAGSNYYFSSIIGSVPLPLKKVTSWSIKVLKSKGNNGDSVIIGVAPASIDQDEECNCDKCGWYLHCYDSRLTSGPPHNLKDEEYGPRKEFGQYVHNGDTVGVVMDTKKGNLSFTLNGADLGVAYEGIPLDKPLVPCVILHKPGDSVELIN